MDLAKQHKTTRIVPVVVFTRLGAFDLQLLLGTEKFHTMQFQFAYCQLPKIHYKDWVNSQNIVARTVMPLMSYSKQDRIDMLHKALQGVLNLESERSKQGKYLEFIEHYAKLTQEDAIELLRQYPQEGENVTTYFQQQIQQGREEVASYYQQLLQQNREEVASYYQQQIQQVQQQAEQSERSVLMRQVARRFGEIPEAIIERIKAAKAQQLE